MGGFSWIIQVGLRYHHRCSYKRETGGFDMHKGQDNVEIESKMECCSHKPKNAGWTENQAGYSWRSGRQKSHIITSVCVCGGGGQVRTRGYKLGKMWFFTKHGWKDYRKMGREKGVKSQNGAERTEGKSLRTSVLQLRVSVLGCCFREGVTSVGANMLSPQVKFQEFLQLLG